MPTKYIVTFHRVYEIPKSLIDERLDIEDNDIDIAEEIARDMLEDEMGLFLDNSNDFVSATVEKINT